MKENKRGIPPRQPERSSHMELRIHCPVCGFDCVHLESVIINKGNQDITLDEASVSITKATPKGRGSLVSVTLWCESGHKWVEHTQFHKGNLLRWHTPIVEDSSSVIETATDLWRD